MLRAMVFLSAFFLATSAVLAQDFYVSPDGDDSNPGTRSEPFATLRRAREAVRQSPDRGEERITVHIGGGTYTLSEPLVLTPEDSGADGAPVVYTAAEGEQPVISGGRRIDDWKETTHDDRRCLQTTLPQVEDGEWEFRQLFVNGDRRPRPRVPDEGFYRFAGATESADNWRGHPESAKFREGDLAAWENLSDVEMVILNHWVDGHDRLEKVDQDNNIVHFKGQAYQNIRDSKGRWARYYVNNVKEALDSPGEWYLDEPTGILRYLPIGSEKAGDTVAYAPRLKTVLELKPGVHDVRFQNLGFRHAEPEVTQNPRQSASTVPGSVILDGTEDVVFYGCDFAHMGGYAVEVKGDSRNNRLAACIFRSLGAGGVRLNNGTRGTWVTDCTIRSGGRIWRSASGILLQDSGWNRLLHNHIRDFYYTGIALGWTWGYTDTQTVDNRVSYNHIHNIGQGVLSDMGGIYLLGTQPGTVLRGNVIHDVESYAYGGWGLYTDQGSSFVVAEDNVVYRTRTGGFHQHYGRANVLRNNIFALSTLYEIKHSRPQHVRSFTITGNIIYPSAEADMLHGRWGRGDYVMKNNIYWSEADRAPRFNGGSLDDWKKGDRGRGSIAAPPLLADPGGGDFSLRADSPASRIGFEPIDTSDVGPRSPAEHPVSFDDWPRREAADKVILEPRLDAMRVRENRSPQEPYFEPLRVEAGETVEIYYRIRNRGNLPASGTVHFQLEPEGAGTVEGEAEHTYELAPGETMEVTHAVTVQTDAMLEARGSDGTVPTTALYITVTEN